MIYYVDGFTVGANPAEEGGFTVMDEGGHLLLHETRKKPNFTNNEAELLAVANAAVMAGAEDTIITDSQNTMAWLKTCKCKARPDLQDLCRVTKALLDTKRLRLVWQPRDSNLAGIYNEERGL